MHDGKIIGHVEDCIIDTDYGKIEALWVRKTGFFGKKLVLLPIDILEWKLKIYVDQESCLSPPDEVLRVMKILEHNMYLYRKKVVTTSGVYIGRVYDFNFDMESYHVLNLYIIRKFLFINYQRRIVPMKEVVEITEDEIVIKSDLKLSKWRRKNIINLKNFVFTPEPKPS